MESFTKEQYPIPDLNTLVKSWFEEHQDKYPDGAEITINITPGEGIEISIKNKKTEEEE